MAQSTLALSFDELMSITSGFLWGNLGPNRGGAEWTAKQETVLKDIVKSGVRRVYKPTPFYAWSWLKPFVSLTLLEDAQTVSLPDDFSGLEGALIVSQSSTYFPSVEVVNPARIEAMHVADSGASGHPQYASLRAVKSPQRGQELYVWPTADGDYTVRAQYSIIPNFLDGTHQVVYGGAEHAETFKESCLAAAEEWNGQPGVHSLAFQREMSSSIEMDQRTKKPQVFGRNRDRSDCVESDYESPNPSILYNGVDYE